MMEARTITVPAATAAAVQCGSQQLGRNLAYVGGGVRARQTPSAALEIRHRSYGNLVLCRRNAWVIGSGGAGVGSLRLRGRTGLWRNCYVSRRELGLGLVVRCGRDDDVVDGPIQEPQYTSYIDPNTGEPSPTFGARTPLPDQAFWGEDMVRITRSGQAMAPGSGGKKPRPEPRKRTFVSNRKKTNVANRSSQNLDGLDGIGDGEGDDEEGEKSSGSKESEKLWYAKNDPEHDPIIAAYKDSLEEANGEKIEEEESVEEEEEEEDDDDDDDANGKEEVGLKLASSSHKEGEGEQEEGVVESAPIPRLPNDELWWNWQKPPKDQEPWSAWHKRPGDGDTVMAAAMAETGQITLFGEKPTIAEATLARARKRVFYNERMRAEQEHRKEIGSVAYYQEWVKEWQKDTSLEAVEEHEKKTGEGVVDQMLDMFQYQTQKEYQHMMGTDIRIRRDPLTMRMRDEQIKQVWGGDPVYPTINYEQDPDCVADYRNANMHEPTPDIIDQLRESGRLITQEEIHAMQAMEKADELQVGTFDDGMTGAIDIGDKEEDEDDDEDEEEEDVEDAGAWNSKVASEVVPVGKAKDMEKLPVMRMNQIDKSKLVILEDDEEDDDDEEEDEESSAPIEEQEE